MNAIPIISLKRLHGTPGEASELAREVDEALTQIGFFIIVDHGIDPERVRLADAEARNFFALPLADKMRIRSTAKGSPRGFVPPGAASLARSSGQLAPPSDIRESFGMGPPRLPEGVTAAARAFYSANVWPDTPLALRAALESYYEAMSELGQVMFTLFAQALDLPADFFDGVMDGHNSTLRVNHYPAQPEAPLPGQIRAGAHTDYGAFTILLPQNTSGGLQVRTRAGDWIDVLAPEDSFVVNIGDLLMRWTNDRWLSNLHRVGNPSQALAASEQRQSLAFFANPREDLLIECLPTCASADNPPRHAPVLAGQYRLSKILATGA